MPENYYYAVICEGDSEKGLFEQLLDQNLLSFSKDDLIEKQTLYRPKDFCRMYLDKSYDRKIKIIRVIDRSKEGFKIKHGYEHRIASNNAYATYPELEMLIINVNDLLSCYENDETKGHPSSFCAKKVDGYKKTYQFFYEFFDSKETIYKAVVKHHNTKQNKEEDLYDFLKLYSRDFCEYAHVS